MTKISELSVTLVGEILSRVPLTSLISARSTCKPWKALSKTKILGQKAESKKKKLEFMIFNSRVCSLSFKDDFLNPTMNQISIFDEIKVSQVFHCDGLLLCVVDDICTSSTITKLMIWNPYLCQTKWIKPRTELNKLDGFALGFDHNNGNHKILRFDHDSIRKQKPHIDVYDFNSDSWRVLDVNVDCSDLRYQDGVTLKGNVYFFDQQVTMVETERVDEFLVTDIVDYLVCFDFTTEKFGPRLLLPFNPPYPIFETISLSWVRDEKLSVFYNHYETYKTVEFWVTNEIKPDAVSWSKFLCVDMSLINGLPDMFMNYFNPRSFFIDEEKKVAVLFDTYSREPTKSKARIIGENGYFKSVDIGEDPSSAHGRLVSSSYVPSLVQLEVKSTN